MENDEFVTDYIGSNGFADVNYPLAKDQWASTHHAQANASR